MSDDLLQRLKVHGSVPAHIAIIMDGNGRWAKGRALPRPLGHHAGMRAVREVIQGSLDADVGVLSLFAFSQENWQRPAVEIDALMSLLEEYIAREVDNLRSKRVSVRILGDLERLAPGARQAVDRIMAETAGGEDLALNLCISYSSRAEITRAARQLAEEVAAGRLDPSDIDEDALARRLYTAPWPDPDLLIRTSGEMRISNFLLWQLAYAELYVTPVLWPDFTRRHLFEAILEFQRRDRRVGDWRDGSGAHEPQHPGGTDLVPLREIEQLPGGERGRQDEQQDQRQAPVPYQQQGQRDRDDGEPDAPHQIGVHQTETRPNRRSRR